jgi:hypothetical protein
MFPSRAGSLVGPSNLCRWSAKKRRSNSTADINLRTGSSRLAAGGTCVSVVTLRSMRRNTLTEPRWPRCDTSIKKIARMRSSRRVTSSLPIARESSRASRRIRGCAAVRHGAQTARGRLLPAGGARPQASAGSRAHERIWGLIDQVAKSGGEIEAEFKEHHYDTKTRGERTVPSMRPAGEGAYALLQRGRARRFHKDRCPHAYQRSPQPSIFL